MRSFVLLLALPTLCEQRWTARVCCLSTSAYRSSAISLSPLSACLPSSQQLASTVYRLGRVYRALERTADERALYATAVGELHIWRHAEQRPAYMFAFPRAAVGHGGGSGGVGDVALIATPWWRGAYRTQSRSSLLDAEASAAAPSMPASTEEGGAGVEARVAEAVRRSPLRAALHALEAAHADVRAEIAALLPSIAYVDDHSFVSLFLFAHILLFASFFCCSARMHRARRRSKSTRRAT